MRLCWTWCRKQKHYHHKMKAPGFVCLLLETVEPKTIDISTTASATNVTSLERNASCPFVHI